MQETPALRARDQIESHEYDLRRAATLQCPVELSASWRDALLAGAAVLKAAKGRVLTAQGAQAELCFCVLSGLVKLYHIEMDGRQTTLDILSKGKWFSEFGVFQGSSQFTAEAMVDSSIAVIRNSAVRNYVSAEIGFGEVMAQLGWQTSRSLLDKLLSQGSVEGRILWLIRKLEHVQANGQNLTQSEIAELSGASRQRVNASLNRLIQSGRLRRCRSALSGYTVPE